MTDQNPLTPFFYAQRVLVQLQNRGQLAQMPIGINAIADAVTAVTSIDRIQFRVVHSANPSVQAIFTRFRQEQDGAMLNVADIILNGSLNSPDLRYVACKELCQGLLSDVEGSRISAPREISAYLAGLLDRTAFTPFSAALQTEQFASICALEILCPFSIRAPLYDEVVSGTRTLGDVARIFDVPLHLAEIALNPGYHENARLSYETESFADFRMRPQSKSFGSDLQIMFQRNVKKALKENEQLGDPGRHG